MDNIKSTSIPHYLKILVYGDSGHGKTRFVGSGSEHPLLGDMLLIDIDGGTKTINGRPNVDISAPITRTSEVEDILWKLAGRTEGYDKYKTVILDSGTELAKINLKEITKPGADPGMPEYKKSYNALQYIIRQFRDLPMNVIITAQAKREFPPPPKSLSDLTRYHKTPTYIGPEFPTALARTVISYMDAAWYSYLDEDDQYKLLTAPSRDVFNGAARVKTRGERFSKKLDKVVVNPNFEEIFDLYLKEEKFV